MADSENTYMVRLEGTFKDLRTLYGEDNKRFFTVEIHHEGRFTKPPGRIYEDGKVITGDFVDLDAFNIKYIDDLVKDVGGTYMNVLTTCKRGESMDYGITRLCYKKEAKFFKETVIKEGLHIPHQIYVEYPDPFSIASDYYPYTYNRTPPEKIAEVIRPYVIERPGRFSNEYNNHFEWLHGIKLDPSLMEKAGRITTDYEIAWGTGDAYRMIDMIRAFGGKGLV